MSAASDFIILTIIVNFARPVIPNVFFIAFLAFVYISISHFTVLVKIGQGFSLSALETTFHDSPLQLMSRGKNSIKYAILKGT